MKRTLVILAAVLGIAAIFGVATSLRQGDDATMIRDTLRQSLEASRRGEPGGVLEGLSSSFTYNNEEQGGLRGMAANFVKNQRPDIEVVNTTPIVTGDEARITSPVKLKMSAPVIGERSLNIKDVVLVFRKETARKYLVFPVKKWRLAEVQAPPMSFDTLSME